jgi:hypothetical protein
MSNDRNQWHQRRPSEFRRAGVGTEAPWPFRVSIFGFRASRLPPGRRPWRVRRVYRVGLGAILGA